MKNFKSLLTIFGLLIAFSFTAMAQNITFTSLDGEKINLESQKGKVVVMAIGASWLPLSRAQADAINKLSRKYAGRDVSFFFIATDSTTAKSKNFASDADIRKFGESSKLTVSILRDADGLQTVKQYKVDQLPTFIILDKTGKLAMEPFGGIDTNPKNDISVTLSRKIDEIL
jgi:thiol-disulfide isomerase/thioredoxin